MGKTSDFGSKLKNNIVTFFPRLKAKVISKINGNRIRKLEMRTEKLDVKLEHNNKKRVVKFVRKCEKELRPEYVRALDVTAAAEDKLQAKLKKFDLKQNWKLRAANHAYAKKLFLEEGVEEAKSKHTRALDAVYSAREKKVAKLTAARDKYLATHTCSPDREAAMTEYNKKLEAKQAEVDALIIKLKEERETRVREAKLKNAEKISEIKESVSESGVTLGEGVVLDVKNLCMYFGGLHAVEDLSFDVKKGEIFGLIGPNGAGKTTVFNCITQFYKCTSGEIRFVNNEGAVVNLKKHVVHDVILEGIARTFQNVEVIKEISVLENLLVAVTRNYSANLGDQALHLPILDIEESRLKERALKILGVLDLLAYKDWLAWGLPYGILKKVEIARALMTNPKLLILDEPAAGLNNTETAQLAQTILKIRDGFGCSILLVEHDMSLVMSICDRICAISFGKMLAIGSPAEIQANKQVQEAYLGVADEGDA